MADTPKMGPLPGKPDYGGHSPNCSSFTWFAETGRHGDCTCGQEAVSLRARVAELEAERDRAREDRHSLTRLYKDAEAALAYWQVCSNCGEPLDGPGICSRATSEHEKGLELMFEEALDRAEEAEAEVARLRQELDDVVVTKQGWASAAHNYALDYNALVALVQAWQRAKADDSVTHIGSGVRWNAFTAAEAALRDWRPND